MCQALVNRLYPLFLDDNTTRAINKVEKRTHKYTHASILVYNIESDTQKFSNSRFLVLKIYVNTVTHLTCPCRVLIKIVFDLLNSHLLKTENMIDFGSSP